MKLLENTVVYKKGKFIGYNTLYTEALLKVTYGHL